MANNRISAATKDMIRKVYSTKVKEIELSIEERCNKLAEIEINKLEEMNEYQTFKEQVKKFCDFLESIDPDNNFCDSYNLRRVKENLKDDSFFKTPYTSTCRKIFSEDKEIKEASKLEESLNKECNKLLWDIEMAPKSSKEYKDAYAKIESMLWS